VKKKIFEKKNFEKKKFFVDRWVVGTRVWGLHGCPDRIYIYTNIWGGGKKNF
jgi:hypothetical protein